MLKLIIVEDEHWTVEGLKRIIPWEEFQIQIAGTAENGEEGIRLMLELEPDIVLTDIKMPVKDGLELAKFAFEHKLSAKVIIISGFAEFEYAKSAIAYGVKSYLTKPVDKEQLKSTINTLLKEIENEGKNTAKTKKMEAALKSQQLYNQLISKQVQPLFEEANRKTQVFLIDGFTEIGAVNLPYEKENQQLRIESFLDSEQDNQLVAAISYAGTFPELNDYHQIALEAIAKIVPFTKETHAAASNLKESQDFLFEAYIEAKRTIAESSLFEEKRIATFNQLKEAEKEVFIPDHIIEESLILVEERNFTKFRKNYLEIMLEKYPMIYSRMFALKILELYKEKKLDNDHHFTFGVVRLNPIFYAKTKESLEKRMMDFVHTLPMITEEEMSEDALSSIQEVQVFIDKNYKENISLNILAEKFFLNATYLSRAFKKQYSININDYIRKKRLDQAVFLLQNTRKKIAEIAETVGYENVNYFMRVFKKEIGKTPNTIRQASDAQHED